MTLTVYEFENNANTPLNDKHEDRGIEKRRQICNLGHMNISRNSTKCVVSFISFVKISAKLIFP
jgi:hypothetical protein